jgi:TctA family transporter
VVVAVFFSCFAGLAAVVLWVPGDHLAQAAAEMDLTDHEAQQVLPIALVAVAVLMLVLVVLPGGVLAGLGVAVLNGKRRWARPARWLATGLLVVLAVLGLISIAQPLLLGRIGDLLVQVAIFGLPLFLLWRARQRLGRVGLLTEPVVNEPEDGWVRREPWEM